MFSPKKFFSDLQPYERDMLRDYLVKPYLIKFEIQLGVGDKVLARLVKDVDGLTGELISRIRRLQTELAKSQRNQEQLKVRLAEVSQLHFDFLKDTRYEKNRSN